MGNRNSIHWLCFKYKLIGLNQIWIDKMVYKYQYKCCSNKIGTSSSLILRAYELYNPRNFKRGEVSVQM